MLRYIQKQGFDDEEDIDFAGFWPWLQSKVTSDFFPDVLEYDENANQFAQIMAQEASNHWGKMKRIVLGRVGSNLNLGTVLARLKNYYLEVEEGTRVQVPKSDQSQASPKNMLIELWRKKYAG